LTFYGLREKPFNTTPDPRYLYLTRSHREALAQLIYSVRDNRGFLVLTGEAGTGKTTLIRTLIERLDPETAVSLVFNSSLPFDGILEYMLHDLGVECPAGETRTQRLIRLNELLIERRRTGQRTVLIIDEAQNLAVETLEQIRLLSNFETPRDKLLQILLIGQPELDAKLQLRQLRQLAQRVELQHRISPLSRTETGNYILARLRMAGAHQALFSARAMARIADAARGFPRRVNILCEHCLVIGYAEQRRSIEPDIVKQAVAAFASAARPQPMKPTATRLTWAVGALVVALLGGIAALPLRLETTQLANLARAARELLVR
jgi:general secretion pathway protein A